MVVIFAGGCCGMLTNSKPPPKSWRTPKPRLALLHGLLGWHWASEWAEGGGSYPGNLLSFPKVDSMEQYFYGLLIAVSCNKSPCSNINLGNVGLYSEAIFSADGFLRAFHMDSGSLLLRILWWDYCSLEDNLRSPGHAHWQCSHTLLLPWTL